MDQWKNRVAVVTGASAGIGAAIVKNLVNAGMIAIGLARRAEKVEALKKDLPANLQGNLHAVKCDISKEDEIVSVFQGIDSKFKGIDVLVNNAGILHQTTLIDKDNSEMIREVMDINVFGLVYCTREAYKSMEKHGRNSHVVHINSTAGQLVFAYQDDIAYNMYTPSKFAVTAITEVHRQEFIRSKRHIKVSSVSPGLVKTDIYMPEHRDVLTKYPVLEPEDIAQSVMYVLGTPPHVQVHELIVKPFGEPY